VDWQLALDSVDRQRGRLDRRIRGFLQEYQPAAQTVREAIASGHHEALHSLTHNLKSTAAYIGAFHLAAQAQALEQALRSDRKDRSPMLAAELADGLDLVVGGLSQLAETRQRRCATAMATRPADLPPGSLSAQRRCPRRRRAGRTARPAAAARNAGLLAAIGTAVDDIEYQAALAPLGASPARCTNELKKAHEFRGNPKVLVADDDIVNRQVLADLLKPEHTVLLAKNGEQTLERAARHLPDLILLDVMMPDMNGYEVLRRLRADAQTAHITVIFISGLAPP
jgi:CheY-like chemotaxis protein